MNRDAGKFVNLRNGGRIAFSEYGSADGRPVFFFHGWPSSRMMGELTHAAACELNIRIISPDRPGIWGSSFQPNRKLLDWPNDLQQLADHLEIESFHVLAFSGGAPYAYATGYLLARRIHVVAIVSGAVPIAEIKDHSGLLPLYRWMMWFHQFQPSLLRGLFYAARPVLSLRTLVRAAHRILKMLPPADADALLDAKAFDVCFESQRKAWTGSLEGVIADARIYGHPLGFRLEDVQTPVRLWHGTQDRAFSFRLAEDVAKRLPNCRLRLVENEGHYSLPIRHMREILEDLVSGSGD